MLVYLSIVFIRFYQRVAPTRIRQSCRFEPSCSEYAILALQKYGFIQGWKKTIFRLKSCHPPNGGYDYP